MKNHHEREPGEDMKMETDERSSEYSMRLLYLGNQTSFTSILDLPPELLLQIFSLFNIKDLCRLISPVCKTWHQISHDYSLWKELVFEGPSVCTEDLCSLLKRSKQLQQLVLIDRFDVGVILREVRRSNKRLKVLVIKGCTGSRDRDHISADLLISVIKACSQIVELTIKDTPFRSTKFYRILGTSLPKLRRLNFNSNIHFDSSALSLIASNCNPLEELRVFRSFGFRSILPHCRDEDVQVLCSRMGGSLKVLKLNAVRLTDASIEAISTCRQLEILHLRYAVNVTGTGLMKLARLQNLTSLNISMARTISATCWCDLFNVANWGNIKKLGLAFCSVVNDEVLNSLSAKCRDLQKLRLSGCVDVTEQGLMNIMKACEKLHYLNYFSRRYAHFTIPV